MKENEIQEYINSYIKPLQECKNAIIESVSNAYHERKMSEVLSEICKKFGYERVSLLVANHVKKTTLGRQIRQSNKSLDG